MRRSSGLALVVLGAAFAALLFSSAAIGPEDETEPRPASSEAAAPQTAHLDWRETYGPSGQKLVFEVERLEVVESGWRARLKLTNRTSVAYEVGDPRATLDRAFGLMLFTTGDLSELKRRNRDGTLPATRPATTFRPSLPKILEPGSSWEGTISAPGALVAGSYVRIVFGTLFAVGSTGDQLDETVVWITDHAYRLKSAAGVPA
jgi:hypothetical protein